MGNNSDPKIRVDIEAGISGFESNVDRAGNKMDEFHGKVEKSARDLESATARVSEALGRVGKEVVSGDFSKLPETLGQAAIAAPELAGAIAALVAPYAAAASAAAMLGKAAYEGHVEMLAMDHALAMTGNAAGQTRADLLSLAETISAHSRLTVTTAREMVTALAASGRIGAESFKASAELVAAYSAATGQSAEAATKYVVSIFEHPAKSAEKLNETMHFLSATELEQIEILQRHGQVSEAQLALAEKLIPHLSAATPELGLLSRAWEQVSKDASKAWAAMMNIGAQKTTSQMLREARAALEEMDKGNYSGFGWSAQREAKQAEIAQLAVKEAAEQDKAAKSAIDAKTAAYDHETEAIRNANSELFKRQEIATKIDRLRKSQDSLSGVDAANNVLAIQALEKKLEEKETKAATQKISDYDRLSKAIGEKIALQEAELAQGEKLSAADKLSVTLQDELTRGTVTLSAKEKIVIEGMIARLKVSERLLALRKDEIQAAKEAYEGEQRRAMSLQKETEAIGADAQKIREHVEEMGLSKTAIYDLRAARIDDQIALKEHQLAEIDATNQSTAYGEALRGNIAALRDRQSALRSQAVKETEVENAKAAFEEWKRGWHETDRLGREVFVTWATEGSNAGKKIGDTLKKALLSAIYEATLKPIAFQIYSSVTGAMGMQGAQGGAGGVGSLLSAGNSAYSMASGGGIAGGFLSGMASAGGEAALGASFVGPSAQLAGGAIGAGAEVGSMIGAGASSVAAAIPYVGAAIAVASMLGLFGGGGPVDRNSKYQRPFGATDSSVGTPTPGGADPWRDNFRFSDSEMGASLNAFNAGLASSEQNVIRVLGLTAEQIDRVNTELNKSADVVFNLGIEHSAWTDSQADEQIMAVRMQAMASALGKSIEEIAAAMDPAFGALVKVGSKIGLTAADLAKLAPTSAQMQSLTANLQTYIGRFYSEAERVAMATSDVAEGFEKLGLTMPSSESEFMAMARALDKTTEAGARQFNGMMALADAFAQVTEASANTTKAALEQARQTSAADGAERKSMVAARRAEQNALAAASQKAADDAKTAADNLFAGIQAGIAGIDAWLKSSLLGSNSTLSPEQKIAEAQRQFDTLYKQASGGDVAALGNITNAADALMNVARDGLASSPAYVAIVEDIRARLGNLGLQNSPQGAAQRQADAAAAMTGGPLASYSGPSTAEIVAATGLSANNAALLSGVASGTQWAMSGTQWQSLLANSGSQSEIIAGLRAANRALVGDVSWGTNNYGGQDQLALNLSGLGTFAQGGMNAESASEMAFRYGLSAAELQSVTRQGVSAASLAGNWADRDIAGLGRTAAANPDFYSRGTYEFQRALSLSYERSGEQIASVIRESGTAQAASGVETVAQLREMNSKLDAIAQDSRLGVAA